LTTPHAADVEIIEVGPRDGLQREKQFVPTEKKIAMIDALSESGIRAIQVTSFVHPKWVPQMADAEAVCAGIKRQPGVRYSGLVLNLKGVERAHDAQLTEIDMSVSASDAHSRKNANRSLNEALVEFRDMVAAAREAGMQVRAGIQCAFGFYTDDVTQAGVIKIAEHHLSLEVDSLALADSTGMANPAQIKAMLASLLSITGDVPVILHLHDTRGMGLANVLAALDAGCRHFDTAFGGLGGCNFIDDAAGNIATEDTVHMLHAMGYRTGVDMDRVSEVSRMLQGILGRPLPGKLYSLAPMPVS
jgi:hydroxymethylglutaryl-CoA lyase